MQKFNHTDQSTTLWRSMLWHVCMAKKLAGIFLFSLCTYFSLCSFFSLPLAAAPNFLNDVNVNDTQTGYDIVIQFITPVFYESHLPSKQGKTLEVQLRQSISASAAGADDQLNINWDTEFGVPLIDVSLDKIHSESPVLILRFSKNVKFRIFSSGDSRSITVSIDTKRPEFKGVAAMPPESGAPDNLITSLKILDPNMAKLLTRANDAMLDKDYSRAVQLFTRIRAEGNAQIKPHIQELMGLAREYNNQLAHAKAEYQLYLKDFPEGEAATRVRQRLTAMITAAQQPKTARNNKPSKQLRKTNTNAWQKQFYGSFGQYYFRNEIKQGDKPSQVARSDMSSQVNLIARARNSKYDVKAQLASTYLKDLLEGEKRTQHYPSTIAVDARIKDLGLYARLGRQSRRSGGLLGRFDGLHTAYDINSNFTLNAVVGSPVDIRQRDKVNSGQSFYGASLDIGNYWDGWEFSSYYITQDNQDIKDRESVGGEVQYFDSTKSFFTLVDFDVYHDQLNMFLLNANWTVRPSTSLRFSYDQRRSPVLLTTNALQGQGLTEFEQLFSRYTLDEVLLLARARSAQITSINLGLNQNINDTWQIDFNVTATEYGGTPASLNIEAVEGTEFEYYYSARLLAKSLFFDNDSIIWGLRYYDTARAQTYSLNTYWRLAMNKKLRLGPRIQVDYRQNTQNQNDRWLLRPTLKLDYRVNRTVRFELDAGYDWLEETFANQSQVYSGYYLRAGYWLQF